MDDASPSPETIVGIALTPEPDARVTPVELLRDFADAAGYWSYLERDSRHYADVKDVPACILRYRAADDAQYVDLAFAADAASSNAEGGTSTESGAFQVPLRLAVMDTSRGESELERATRHEAVQALVRHLRDYLADRPRHATLHVETEDGAPDS
jgi:hypothetical protein